MIRRCATVLTNALERARKHGVIDDNPAKDAERPKLVRTKPRSPSENELCTLLATVTEADPQLGDALHVMAGTGVRMGELLGLQWPEVDLDAAEMHVASSSDGKKLPVRSLGIFSSTPPAGVANRRGRWPLRCAVRASVR